MIRCLLTTPEGDVREGDIRLMDEWMRMPTAHLWVDMKGESEAQEREILERFECHPMAIQDAHKDAIRRKSKSSTTHADHLSRHFLVRCPAKLRTSADLFLRRRTLLVTCTPARR